MAVAAFVITALVTVISLLIYVLFPSKRRRILDKIPGPPAYPPPVGNAYQFKPGGSGYLLHHDIIMKI